MEEIAKEKKYYNLSIPQENIWLTEQLYPNTTINNVFGTFFMNHSVNIDLLKKAINKIIENNDALRIRLVEINSEPKQYIAPYEYEDLPVYYLENSDSTKINAILDAIALEHMSVFNHKLYDLRLIVTPENAYVCMKMHHLIADAWSLGQIFVKNIKKYYDELEESRVTNVQSSYIDYLEKNNLYRNSEKYEKDRKFWQNYVKNISYQNHLEMDKDKKSKRIEKMLSPQQYTKIANFCKEQNISEYSFWLGILSTYFSKIFSLSDFVIGTPFLNRKKTNREFDTLGMFVATLPIHVRVDENQNFVDLCKAIHATNLSCFKHANFPYADIQKEYTAISGNHTNLYEIAFSYHMNNLENEMNPEIYQNAWLPNPHQLYPLLISYTNHFGEHKLYYDYLENCFEQTEIDYIHERLITIINQITRNSSIIVKNIKILSTTDIEILKQFNDTGIFPENTETVVSQFEKMVQKNKSKTALIYNDLHITYHEFNKMINSVANSLISLGIKKGTPISMIFDKSIEMFVTILGIQKAGGYFIPILPEEEQKRAEFIIQNSESQVLITQRKYSTQISKNIIANQLIFDDLQTGDTSNPHLAIDPNDLCYVIYTSGSTGTPKGVMITHHNLVSLMVSLNQTEDLQYYPNDISLSLLKYSFDGCAFDTFSAFLNGGTLVIIPKEFELNPEAVSRIIEKEKVTRFISVPTWADRIQNISKAKKIDLSSIRFLGLGGEAVKPQKIKYLHETYPETKIYNVYGPTEATILTTMHKITANDIENNYAPIGVPIPCSRMLVMGNDHEILPIHTKGELVIFQEQNSLPNIGKGYFKLDEKTKQNFIKFVNPITNKVVLGYKTGDSVKINHQLELDFFGRNDDIKKINGGYLVSLNEVENKIQKSLGNAFDIAVVTIPIRNINSIILFVAKKNESLHVSLSDIQNEISQNLTFYMVPKKIIEIDKIPITHNGKSDKKLLEQKAIDYLKEKNNLQPPTNKTEQKIYDIIKEMIHSDFSITDDFEKDLGIDSLNMAILYSKLNNRHISIQDLYIYPTVKDLAYLFKKEFEQDETFEINPIKIQNAASQMNLDKVLLTGSTGFVGSHILHELANCDQVSKIYCIVRQKLNISCEERFRTRMQEYFDEETCKKILKKAVIVNADLRKENLGLDYSSYQRIFHDVTTIINAAANVKHIGKYSESHIDNTETVERLVKICKEFSINLAHISTLSLNGYPNPNVHEIFTENTLNIGQTFNKNPYLISKFEAEQHILKNIAENNLNAKIFRIGNIMPRISDGVFQTNFNQNGFLIGITSLIQLNAYTEQMQKKQLLLTPVDECCKAICEILKSDYGNTIYHIESTKKISFSSILEIIHDRNPEITLLSEEQFLKKMTANYTIGIEYLKNIMMPNTNKYQTTITEEILHNLNFEWSPIRKNYLENLVNLSMKMRKGEEN